MQLDDEPEINYPSVDLSYLTTYASFTVPVGVNTFVLQFFKLLGPRDISLTVCP
jgi:hypothetical protein